MKWLLLCVQLGDMISMRICGTMNYDCHSGTAFFGMTGGETSSHMADIAEAQGLSLPGNDMDPQMY